jgi:hypothetical protein
MNIVEILQHLDEKEIDYRLESNHCVGYIFYFLDGSIFPRRFHDHDLDETIDFKIVSESTDHLLERITHTELEKDWKHRIVSDDISDTFKKVEEYLFLNAT